MSEDSYEVLLDCYVNQDMQIGEWTHTLSEERKLLALDRAMRILGFDEYPDEDDYRYDEMIEAFGEQLKRMAASDLLAGLAKSGHIRVIKIDEDGELVYTHLAAVDGQ